MIAPDEADRTIASEGQARGRQMRAGPWGGPVADKKRPV